MQNDRTGELLNLIGQLLAEDVEYSNEDTLLYARLARAHVAPSIFKNLGNHILYHAPDLNRLGDALLDLWYEQGGEERWEEIEYIVRNGRFEAAFIYPDDIDPEEDTSDRRDRVVAKYFGNKPIVYPDPDEEDQMFDL
ncbi:hypothetical protein ACMGDH_11430 [Sphingomonas sp. DT-207]|uniref:hypothetical protein n=1 Tax=Sphingomonas sp. DT-207 TaxID=3396167 RepID=UPI003F1ADADB